MSRPLGDRIQAFRAGRISLEALLLELMRRHWFVPMTGDDPYIDQDSNGNKLLVAMSDASLLADGETPVSFPGHTLVAMARNRGAGIGFDANQPHATNLLAQQLDVLDPWAAVARLEHDTQVPRAGEAERFRRASWFTFVADGKVAPVELKSQRLLALYTTEGDARAIAGAKRLQANVQRLDGPMLFAGLDPTTVDGVAFHGGLDKQVVLGRDFLEATAAGRDLRPGAVRPEVRSVAEARVLVEQLGASVVRNEVVEQQGAVLAHYFVERNGHPYSIYFEMPPAQQDDVSLGEGVSPCLCAGFLEQKARMWTLAAQMPGGMDAVAMRRLRQAAAFVEELQRQRAVYGEIDASRMRTAAGFTSLRMQPTRFEAKTLSTLQLEIDALLEEPA